jgi:hypothetical protein
MTEGAKPMSWFPLTTETVARTEYATKMIELHKKRWRIEERHRIRASVDGDADEANPEIEPLHPLDARKVYSGVGGQADFIRGAQYSPEGVAIIALKSTTDSGISKIVDRCPAGITTTAIPADNVIIVTEHGAFDPRRLSLGERALGIAHLAAAEHRDKLLQTVRDDPAFHHPRNVQPGRARGFISYEQALA